MRGLSERAKEVADTTEEHIKLGKFMAHGSTNLITSMYTRMMDITQKYFNIQYGLTTENLMAIKDMLLQYNELDMTVENYKSVSCLHRSFINLVGRSWVKGCVTRSAFPEKLWQGSIRHISATTLIKYLVFF